MNAICKMRCQAFLFAMAFVAGSGALAQSPGSPPSLPANASPPPMPANAMPPPMPAGALPAAATTAAPAPLDYSAEPDEPQVTIIRKDEQTVEEVRVGGVLRYVRVTPRHGRTYYLVPTGNGQTFNRMDSLGGGLSVPMWELFSW